MEQQIARPQKPRRTKPATVKEVEALRTPGRHSIGGSLIVVVKPSGSRSWVARIVDHAGKRRDVGLGPLADLPLAEARERARKLRNAGREGIPHLTRAQRRRLERQAPTFKEATMRFYAAEQPTWKNGKHQQQWLATMELHAFPKLGDMGVDEIGVPHVIDVLTPIWNRTPETARRVRQRICAVLNWAHAREYRPTQVSVTAISTGLGRQGEGEGRHKGGFAALPYTEVAALLSTLRGTDTMGSMALQFVMFTAARSGEVRGCAWSEINAKAGTWTIPGDRMKAGREHVVPLSDAALAIVERARAISTSKTLVFPGLGGKQMSDATMSKALRTAGIAQDRGSVHGLRSTFRDWVSEETNYPGDVAEAALAHTIRDKVEAAYRRGNLLAKRKEMMAAWASYCEGATNVVRMVAK